MTDEEIADIEALAEAATKGPWRCGTAMCCPDMGWVDGPKERICGLVGPKRTHSIDANDAAFIAAARTAVPALVEEVLRLRHALSDAMDENEILASVLRDARNETLAKRLGQ